MRRVRAIRSASTRSMNSVTRFSTVPVISWNVADQEQRLEQVAVELVQRLVVGGLGDGALDGGVQEAFDRGVEAPERH